MGSSHISALQRLPMQGRMPIANEQLPAAWPTRWRQRCSSPHCRPAVPPCSLLRRHPTCRLQLSDGVPRPEERQDPAHTQPVPCGHPRHPGTAGGCRNCNGIRLPPAACSCLHLHLLPPTPSSAHTQSVSTSANNSPPAQFTLEERGVKDVDKYKGILTYGGKKDGVDSAVGTTDLTGKVRRGCVVMAGGAAAAVQVGRPAAARTAASTAAWQAPLAGPGIGSRPSLLLETAGLPTFCLCNSLTGHPICCWHCRCSVW